MIVEHLNGHVHDRMKRPLALVIGTGEVDERLVGVKHFVTVSVARVIRLIVNDPFTGHAELLPFCVREGNVGEDVVVGF